jgi:muramidase (phage lysozyme)
MASPIQNFFDVILEGESKGYNDHNWYTSGGLKGYIEGSYGTPYPLLRQSLSKYTLGDIMAFQEKPRDSNGQLWATGRYQIIPSTLKGLANSLKLPSNRRYDQATQDLLGYQLLLERTNLRKYLQQEVADTDENLKNAALDVAKIWSSVGVPFPIQGSRQFVQANQSYYQGGGDRASTDTSAVQQALKNLRKNKDKVFRTTLGGDKKKSRRIVFFSIIGITIIGLSIYAFKKYGK